MIILDVVYFFGWWSWWSLLSGDNSGAFMNLPDVVLESEQEKEATVWRIVNII